jgi:excisionase family DNA binding protein
MAIRAHTIKTAAARLELSERKIRELVSTGELGSVKIGRSRRVTDDQLAAFLSRLQDESEARAA